MESLVLATASTPQVSRRDAIIRVCVNTTVQNNGNDYTVTAITRIRGCVRMAGARVCLGPTIRLRKEGRWQELKQLELAPGESLTFQACIEFPADDTERVGSLEGMNLELVDKDDSGKVSESLEIDCKPILSILNQQ